MQNYFRLLKTHPQFRYLWLSQVISLTGDWFNTIATVILVNRYTDSGLAVGALFLARALPPFLFGPLGGVAADRFDRRMILAATNLLRVFIVLGFLLVTDENRVWLLYTLTIAQFTVSAFFEPSYAAILPNLVDTENLVTANTLGSITWSAMLTLGAAVGGVMTGLFGVEVSLLIDAATFAAAAFFTFRIAAQPAKPTSSEGGYLEFVQGLQYVWQRPEIGLFTLVKGMGQIGSVDIAVVVYAERVFRVGKEGAITLGLLFAAHGLGAILGPVIGDRIGGDSDDKLRKAISWGFVLIPLGWLVMGTGPTLAVVTLGGLLRGAGGSINWTYSSVLIQKNVPDKYLGRVFGLDFSIFTLMLSLSIYGMGLALDELHVDPRALLQYIALGSLIPLSLWIMAMQRFHMPALAVED
jgi:MFS family permease